MESVMYAYTDWVQLKMKYIDIKDISMNIGFRLTIDMYV